MAGPWYQRRRWRNGVFIGIVPVCLLVGAMAVAVAAAGIRHSSYGLVHTARCEFARWVEKQHGEATFCCFGVDFLLELLLLFLLLYLWISISKANQFSCGLTVSRA